MKLIHASSLGNTFAIVDKATNEDTNLAINAGLDYIRKNNLDSVLLVESLPNSQETTEESTSTINMRVLEKDGTESQMCGNGIRAIAEYYKQAHHIRNLVIHTLAGVRSTAYLEDGLIRSNVGTFNLTSEISHLNKVFYDTNVGEPHLVTFTDDINEARQIFEQLAVDVAHTGDFFKERNLPNQGTTDNFTRNLNIVQVDKEDPTILHHRVYERGVNAETQACGTGASCVTGTYLTKIAPELAEQTITVKSPGGEIKSELSSDNTVYLTGKSNIFQIIDLPSKD